MTTPIKTVRVSHEGRDKLILLKRHTGIGNWNVLCRWALCRSLSEPTPPGLMASSGTSTVEMSWAVFAGNLGDVFLALLRQRCHEDGLPTEDATVAEQFRLHLHRGIFYLAADRCRGIEEFVSSPLAKHPIPPCGNDGNPVLGNGGTRP